MLALSAGATVGALFFATLYLQRTLGYSPLAAGAGFAPVTLIVLVASPVAGRLVTRLGARPLLVAGSLLAGGGLLLLAGLPADGSYLASILPGLALVAFGNGLSFAPILATATGGVSAADQGLASGLVNTAQELGSALGLAVLASIAAASGGAALAGYRWGYLAAARSPPRRRSSAPVCHASSAGRRPGRGARTDQRPSRPPGAGRGGRSPRSPGPGGAGRRRPAWRRRR
jgi:MFS family permease